MEAQKNEQIYHCDWVIEQAKEIRALLSYHDARMIELNRVRSLSAIETSIKALQELEAFIKNI